MQAKVEKLGEDKYVLKDRSDDRRVAVPMQRMQIRALVLEVLYGPKVDLLLSQADEEHEQQVDFEEVTARDISSMGPPSLPVGTDNTDFRLTGNGAGGSQEPGPEDLAFVEEEVDQPDTVVDEKSLKRVKKDSKQP